MAVHFVYRCPYVGPSGRHVVHFPDDTVLAWFRRVWSHLVVPDDHEQAYPRLAEMLGTGVYDFDNLFENAAEAGAGPPTSEAKLREYVAGFLSVQEVAHYRPHALQALTDDDDVMLAYFLFDDHFVARYPERVALLLTEGWQLPGGAGEGGFTPAVGTIPLPPPAGGEGTTFVVPLGIYAGDHLDGFREAYRLDGARLPDLVRYLVRHEPDEDCWPRELPWIREKLITEAPGLDRHERAFLGELRAQPDDEATWRAYSDWLADHGQPPAGIVLLRRALEALSVEGFSWGKPDPSLTHLHAEGHLVQMCVHRNAHELADRSLLHHWDQWYFFDDLWAAAHPALANGLLAYSLRWDALSSWRARPLEAD